MTTEASTPAEDHEGHGSTPEDPDEGRAPAPEDPDTGAVTTDPPLPPGSDVATLVDEMEKRVLHGEEEDAQREKEATDSSRETPEPEDTDPSGGDPV